MLKDAIKLFKYNDYFKDIHYIYTNTCSKNFVPFFTKIARMEDYEISHTYSLYREEVQNANIF